MSQVCCCHSESTAKSWDFDSIGPDDYQNYSSYRDEVAGVQYRIEEAKRFAEGAGQSLEFERETNNAHDQNAIKIIGVFQENGRTCRVHLGYVDSSNAESIANDQVYDFVRPVLKQIWWGGYVRDFIVIRYQSIILSAKLSEVKAKRKAANPPKKKSATKKPTKRKKKDI